MDLTRLLARIDQQIADLKCLRADVAFAIEQQTGIKVSDAGDAFLVSWPEYRPNGDWNKIDVIKAVRFATNLGLREAKEGVETCSPSNPFPLGYRTADEIARLREVGCVVEVRNA